MNSKVMLNLTSEQYEIFEEVCEAHFKPHEIIRKVTDYDEKNGKTFTVALKTPKLQQGAVPSQFPNCPSYMSSPASVVREAPDERRVRLEVEALEKTVAKSMQEEAEFIEKHGFETLEQLKNKKTLIDTNEFWTMIEKDNKLKSRMEKNYGCKGADDFMIYRFLKARNFVVQKAEDMLIKHFDWKRKYKTDTILEDFKMSEILRTYMQFNVIGFDNEGHPIVFVNFGKMDFKGLVKSEKKSHILEYLVSFYISCEKLLQEQSQKYGRPIETWNAVVDFENFPILQAASKLTIDLLLDIFSLYEANFPERLKVAYVINVSMAFFIVYNAVKPILSAATLKKIIFYGKDGYPEDLLKIMDPDDLPAFLGGNKTDPDGNKMCITTIHHGGIVPECHYFRSTERRLCGQPGVTTYHLDRKGKVDVLFNVVQPGSFVEWEFETENNDIAFSFSYKGKIDRTLKPIPLIPTQRVNAHVQSETGKYLCQKVGTYILTLDNSYSWLRQKKVFCRTSISVNDQPDVVQN